MSAAVDLNCDETAEGFFRRISGANPDPLEATRVALAEAKKNAAYYYGQYFEVRDAAAACETTHGRESTMAHAQRLQGQRLIWERRAAELKAELEAAELELKSAPAQVAPVVLTSDQCAAVDDTHNFRAVVA